MTTLRLSKDQEAELRRLIDESVRTQTKKAMIHAFLDGCKTPVKFTETLPCF